MATNIEPIPDMTPPASQEVKSNLGPRSSETHIKPRRKNYNQLHSRPLPLLIHPLPAFIPHNPLSLLRLAYVFICHTFFPPSSHVKPLYQGYFSPETRSVHVTDPATIRALWEQGFFGKGTLSRSEPTWLEAEKTRQGLAGAGTAEENTRKRRQERKKFKEERALKEQEAIDELLRKELTPKLTEVKPELSETITEEHAGANGPPERISHTSKASLDDLEIQFPIYARSQLDTPSPTINRNEGRNASHNLPTPPPTAGTTSTEASPEPSTANALKLEAHDSESAVQITIPDQEHLQLTLAEAFFLRYALGVLDLSLPKGPTPTNIALLTLFRQHFYFPPRTPDSLGPDDTFLLNYAVYHHFRSLGWVARPGLKFSVDYLLYHRGPVFTHAAYAVLIIPAYVDPYWSATEEQRAYVEKKTKGQDWHWLHCVNRVQSQVLKTLVLAYVEVPSPQYLSVHESRGDVGGLLKGYKVREIVVRRWIPQRNLK